MQFDLKEFGVAYHAVLKKILMIPRFSSNHHPCMMLNTLCYNHFLNLKKKQVFNLVEICDSPCFYRHKVYFLRNSIFKDKISTGWKRENDVDNILEYDIYALLSRIIYVQCREPSTMFIV